MKKILLVLLLSFYAPTAWALTIATASCHLSLMVETRVDSYLITLNSTLLFFA